ncbi:hypothetical protein Bca4012_029733 [Brassica carinata]
MVHGVHVLALEKKKRGMMQEVLVQKLTTSLPTDSKFAVALAVFYILKVDMFTSAQEKLHDWISRNPPITPLRRTMKLLFTPRVTSLHQGYGFIEFFREEDADYAIKVLYISSMERLCVTKANQDKKSMIVGANL